MEPNEPHMLPKRTNKARVGIYRSKIRPVIMISKLYQVCDMRSRKIGPADARWLGGGVEGRVLQEKLGEGVLPYL